jgi:hypothetical protein
MSNKQKDSSTMNSMIKLCGAAALVAAIATPAAAQVPGVYSGNSNDGQSISFTVGTDPNNGSPQLISAGISFSAPCKNSKYVFNSAWGFGLSSDITNGAVSFVSDDAYFVFNVSLQFSADSQSATGTIESISPTLYKEGPNPRKALICTSPTQPLSLTLQPADAPRAPRVNQQHVRPNGELKIAE